MRVDMSKLSNTARIGALAALLSTLAALLSMRLAFAQNAASAKTLTLAPPTCADRWETVGNAAVTVRSNGNGRGDKQARGAVEAALGAEAGLRLDPKRYEPVLCGARLLNAEKRMASWRADGLLPNAEEKADAAKRDLLIELGDAFPSE